jgi:uncharacterized protein
MIPKREECLRLLEEHGVPENIRQHILQVTRIAMFLGKRISKKESVNLPLLEAACLLHDLDKHMTFEQVHNHGLITAGILRELGYDEVVPLMASHRISSIKAPGLRTLEERILYYADMRVKHDEIKPLRERITYIKEKYGVRSPEAMRKILEAEPLIYELEKSILGKAKVSSELEGME